VRNVPIKELGRVEFLEYVAFCPKYRCSHSCGGTRFCRRLRIRQFQQQDNERLFVAQGGKGAGASKPGNDGRDSPTRPGCCVVSNDAEMPQMIVAPFLSSRLSVKMVLHE